MNILSIVVLTLLAVIVLTFIYQKVLSNNCNQELKNTVIEAKNVSKDLEEMLENAANISRIIVDDIDKRLSSIEGPGELLQDNKSFISHEINDASLELVQETKNINESINDDEKASKIRVHVLAKELGMNSKRLITILQDMGYDISHHMNFLDDNTVNIVRGKILAEYTQPPLELIEGKGKIAEKMDNFIRADTNCHKRLEREELLQIKLNSSEHKDKKYLSGDSSELDIAIEDLQAAHPYLAVRTLHEKGFSIREIARLLNRGQGEISLILNLIKKKQACL